MEKDKGLTLVELVASLAILAIVSVVVVGFISIAGKTFRSVNTEVNLQYEAQLTINQLKDLIVDSNRGIVYGMDPLIGDFTLVDMDVAGAELSVLQSLEAADSANVGTVKRCILIYNAKYLDASDTYEYPVIKIVWDPVTKALTYGEKVFASITELEADPYLESLTAIEYSFMSEYMDSFQVLMINSEDKKVELKMELDSNGKNYAATPSVSLRNKISTSEDLGVIYGDIPIEKPSLIERVEIQKAGITINSDTQDAGDQVQYSAKVEVQFGASASSDAVQWTLAGNRTYGTGTASTISQTGLLTVSEYELSNQIVVTATSIEDTSKKMAIVITIENLRGEFGYVSALSPGQVLHGDIAAANATNGPFAYYGIDFSDTPMYITYVNEEKLLVNEKGVTWQIITDAPTGSYEVGQLAPGSMLYGLEGKSPIYIKAYYAARDYEFQIKATTKGNGFDGNPISVIKTFVVSGLQAPAEEVQPVLGISLSNQSLSRNGTITATKEIQNVINPVVTWNINTSLDTDFSEVEQKRKSSNVYRDELSNGNQTLYAKSGLDWNREFTFQIEMTVTGFTNMGNQVNQTAKKTVTIPAVSITVTPKTGYVAYSTSQKVIPTAYSFQNLKIGSEGLIDKNLVPTISFDNIIYYYQTRRANGGLRNRTSDFADSEIVYQNATQSIVIQTNTMWLINSLRTDGTNRLDFDMQFSLGDNTIAVPIQYIFY